MQSEYKYFLLYVSDQGESFLVIKEKILNLSKYPAY